MRGVNVPCVAAEGEIVAADTHVVAWEKEREMSATGGLVAQVCHPDLQDPGLLATRQWRGAERLREITWTGSSSWRQARLRQRAFLVAKSLPVLPGRSVLELGAGSGAWTGHLSFALAGRNSLTAAVFNEDLARRGQAKGLPDTTFVYINDVESAFPAESFHYVVSSGILTDELLPSALELVHRWLKPGGRFLFFVPNSSNPLVYCRTLLDSGGRGKPGGARQQPVNLKFLKDAAVQRGFDEIETFPSEVIPPTRSAPGQAMGLILERSPLTRSFSSVVAISGSKPGAVLSEDEPQASLAVHPQLFGAVSVVVPCHNEETNIRRLVKSLVGLYGDYLHEIVIVDDNSTDRTSEVVAEVSAAEPRVKLVKRTPPGGVGRALRDGYAAATGKYILTIDCDFTTIAAEFKGLFDAVAEGYDGAIGSRFSSESALVRYPLAKILCNRGYHLLLNLLLGRRVRDISNNLKLYRADILKTLKIEEDGFAANVETGLKPVLLNYRILEVPTSWINRTQDMGTSSFSLLKVGPDYLGVLLRTTWQCWRGQYRLSR